jgi:hypothetical protein
MLTKVKSEKMLLLKINFFSFIPATQEAEIVSKVKASQAKLGRSYLKNKLWCCVPVILAI